MAGRTLNPYQTRFDGSGAKALLLFILSVLSWCKAQWR